MTTSASLLPDGGFLSQPWQGHTARLASRRLRSWVAVISAHGDIDASNADTLTEYTLGHLMGCRGLILDLRGLDFFGTEGFAALHRVSVCCARARIGWAVVPGEAVCRMLRIGDPQGLLPAAGTVEAAMTTFGDQPHRRPPPVASRSSPGQSGRCKRTVCLVCGGTQQVRHEQPTLTETIATLDGHAGSAVDDAVERDVADVAVPVTDAELSARFERDAIPLLDQLYDGALRMTRRYDAVAVSRSAPTAGMV